MKCKSSRGSKIAKITPCRTTGLLKELCCLSLDNFFDIINRLATTIKARNQFISSSFIKFYTNRIRRTKLRNASLSNKISRNVPTRFCKACTFAFFNRFPRRQHDVNVFTSHDGPVLFSGQHHDGLTAQNIGQVLLFLKC